MLDSTRGVMKQLTFSIEWVDVYMVIDMFLKASFEGERLCFIPSALGFD